MSRSLIRSIATALALTLSAGAGISTNALAANPRVPVPNLLRQPPIERVPIHVSPPRVGLRIDTKALGADAEPIAAKVQEQAELVFYQDGILEPLDDQDPVIVVVVERARNSEDPGYVIGFSIEQGEDVVPDSARQSDCSLCTRTELIERIEAELPKLLELAYEVQVDRGVYDDGAEESGDEGEEDGGEPVKAIGPLGFAGIGLGVVGLGGLGAGVGLMVKGVEPIDDQPGQRRNFRTPGTVILAVGGAALVAGVVMIALDVSKRKKARASAKVRWDGLGFSF